MHTFPFQAGSWQHVMVVALLCAAMGTSGCIVGPDNCLPASPAPDVWHQTLEHGQYVGTNGLCEWWTQFNDPILNHLVDYARGQNLDLYAAVTRIWQARAQLCIAQSRRFWHVDRVGSFRTSLQSKNALGFGGISGASFLIGPRDFWTKGFDVSWELDLFGRITRQIQAADNNLCAQVEAFRDVMVTLYGDIAATYVEARTLQKRIEYALSNIEIQKQALELATKRVEGGVSPVLDQYQAESNLASTEAELPPLESALHRALYRLSVLMGEYPGSLHQLICPVVPIPEVPPTLPLVVPCDVIRQRPDIRQAERIVAVRTAEVGVAMSDLYPRFILGGTFSLQAQQFSDLLESLSYTYNFGPQFTWPLFRRGEIVCNIERTQAAVEEAIAIYEQTVLLAVEEVEDAIVSYDKELERREALRRTVVATKKSLGSVLELYRGGKTNFQNVLDTQRTLFLAQDSLAGSEGQTILHLVSLYKALGGGWRVDDHCDRGVVRLCCPERGSPELCDIKPPKTEQPEILPSPGEPDEEKPELDSDPADLDVATQRDAQADTPKAERPGLFSLKRAARRAPAAETPVDLPEVKPTRPIETLFPGWPSDLATTPSTGPTRPPENVGPQQP